MGSFLWQVGQTSLIWQAALAAVRFEQVAKQIANIWWKGFLRILSTRKNFLFDVRTYWNKKTAESFFYQKFKKCFKRGRINQMTADNFFVILCRIWRLLQNRKFIQKIDGCRFSKHYILLWSFILRQVHEKKRREFCVSALQNKKNYFYS